MKMTKRHGVALFGILAAAAASIIIFHHNPAADPREEFLKKVISCVVILAGFLVFTLKYDKITVLPAELFQKAVCGLLPGGTLGDGTAGSNGSHVLYCI